MQFLHLSHGGTLIGKDEARKKNPENSDVTVSLVWICIICSFLIRPIRNIVFSLVNQ
jgi:hypothetical protein